MSFQNHTWRNKTFVLVKEIQFLQIKKFNIKKQKKLWHITSIITGTNNHMHFIIILNILNQLLVTHWHKCDLTMFLFQGTYYLYNYTTKEQINVVPVFFYNKYRAEIIYSRFGKRIGCIQIFAEIVPKRKHSAHRRT